MTEATPQQSTGALILTHGWPGSIPPDRRPWRTDSDERSRVPTGVAVFAEDVAIRRYAEEGNNIVHWTDFDRGGHFAAMEEPELLVDDVRDFFRWLP